MPPSDAKQKLQQNSSCSHCSCSHEPELIINLEQTEAPPTELGIRSVLHINEMDCPNEEALIRKKLSGWPGLHALQFDLMQRCLTVQHEADALPSIIKAIKELGMSATHGEVLPSQPETNTPWYLLHARFVAAAGLAVAAECAHILQLPDYLIAMLALCSVLLSGLNTYKKGWIAVRHLDFNINALMSIAVTGALFLQQWPEAAAVMCLFTLAELIEARSLDHARNSVRELMALAPDSCDVLTPSGWQSSSSTAIEVGQTIRVKAGEKIPLDGLVTQGVSAVNQSALTGESMPVDKGLGDRVFAGSVNISGVLEVKVTAKNTDTTLARIIKTVQEAQASRAPMQRFVDQFARIYTPVVLVLAVLVACVPPFLLASAWQPWIYKALVLLVIACPCALVISTPVTVVSGITAAARQGILIKGGVILEKGRNLQWLAFDKTGTLTVGKPVQTDMMSFSRDENVFAIAASLAEQSTHPVSQAILSAAKHANIELIKVFDQQTKPGFGIIGKIADKQYELGKARNENSDSNLAANRALANFKLQGKTTVALYQHNLIQAVFAVSDQVKTNSRGAIEALHKLGIKTLMLTGDHDKSAAAVAEEVGIDEVAADLMPEQKRLAIKAKKADGAIVGMVGDGINDSPALAQADIGFAMGVMGTASALETADVALMDDDLGKIADFVRLSRATYKVLIINICLALLIKAAFVLLTVAGVGTMWMAVFADMGTSLIVIGNGLTLLRFFPGNKLNEG